MSEQNVKNSKSNSLRIGLVILAGILIIVLIILIDKNSKESSVSSSTDLKQSSQRQENTRTEAPAQKINDATASSEINLAELPVNTGIIVKTGCLVKIVQFDDNADVKNEYKTPGEGNRFLAYSILMDNTKGKKDMNLVASGSFKLKDNQDNVYKAEVIIGKEPMFDPTNTIKVGEKSKGWVTFDLPKSIKYNQCKIKYEFLNEESDWIKIQ